MGAQERPFGAFRCLPSAELAVDGTWSAGVYLDGDPHPYYTA